MNDTPFRQQVRAKYSLYITLSCAINNCLSVRSDCPHSRQWLTWGCCLSMRSNNRAHAHSHAHTARSRRTNPIQPINPYSEDVQSLLHIFIQSCNIMLFHIRRAFVASACLLYPTIGASADVARGTTVC